MTARKNDAILNEAADAMIRQQIRSESGIEAPHPVVDADAEAARLRGEADAEHDREIHLHVDELHADGLRLANDYERVTALDAPGETERGWSPEVTARHPALLARTMAELAGDGKRRGEPKVHGIDPTDVEALQHALSQEGFREVRMTNLMNKAIEVNYERLAAAQEDLNNETSHHQMAMQEAVDRVERTAEAIGFRNGKPIKHHD